MTHTERDRDASGRPRNARPRDDLGRPLPRGPQSPAAAPEGELARLEAADFPELLAGAQRLLDAGRPFEAHEVLEAAWKRAPDPERALFRALAQLAVGLTHHARGNPAGARALFARAAETLGDRPEGAGRYGIDAAALATAARSYAAGGPPGPVRLMAGS